MDTQTKPSYDEALSAARTVDTTTGTNGYPRHLKVAYTADTMGELRALKEAAEAEGHEVAILQLHRRDGWSLWERSYNHDLNDDAWMGIGEQDHTIRVHADTDREQEAFEVICGTKYEVESAFDMLNAAENVRALAKELPSPNDLEEGEEVIVFLDANNGYSIDYAVRTGQNGYARDTHHYCTALLIEEREQEEEDAEE
jgi:hypothetical protein